MIVNWEQELELLRYLEHEMYQSFNGSNFKCNFDVSMVNDL